MQFTSWQFQAVVAHHGGLQVFGIQYIEREHPIAHFTVVAQVGTPYLRELEVRIGVVVEKEVGVSHLVANPYERQTARKKARPPAQLSTFTIAAQVVIEANPGREKWYLFGQLGVVKFLRVTLLVVPGNGRIVATVARNVFFNFFGRVEVQRHIHADTVSQREFFVHRPFVLQVKGKLAYVGFG